MIRQIMQIRCSILSDRKKRDPTYNRGTALRIMRIERFRKKLGQSGEGLVVFFCERNVKPYSSKAVQKNTTKPAASFGKQRSK
jgi:hypothetical protein